MPSQPEKLRELRELAQARTVGEAQVRVRCYEIGGGDAKRFEVHLHCDGHRAVIDLADLSDLPLVLEPALEAFVSTVGVAGFSLDCS